MRESGPPRRLADTPIAIVGMAGLFPHARDVREFWQNIVDARDCIEDIPASRWNIDDYYDADPTRPDHTYSRRGGFVPDVDFDPLEFGLPPNQLEVTSTLQTLSLVVARDLLRDAGATDSTWYDSETTGVVLGVTGPVPLMHPLGARLTTPVLREVVRACGLTEDDAQAIATRYAEAFAPWEENSFPGLLANVTAGRIANRLGLGGMNCTVDAACAASLSAVRMAIAELVDGRSDMMIAGGADTENSIFGYMCFSKTQALSKSDRIRPFDEGADGTLIGEGVGMIALRRLADAERDGNRIYAVIRGLGSSSDGRSKSIYAPRAEGQERALRRAYADADCSPASVELFEAHATGTAVGDRTELTALDGVLRAAADGQAHFAAIGSVKSQIGHTKGAAGTASLMKLALSLYQKTLPPTINVERPNGPLAEDATPLYVNTRTRPWIRDPRRPVRRAAASAMGFGGTNFHVVLEEHSALRPANGMVHRTARAWVWHAPDPAALRAALEAGAAPTDGPIPADHARVGFVTPAGDPDGAEPRRIALAQLAASPDAEQWTHPAGVYYRRRALADLRVGALFAGQGSQYLEMGLDAVLGVPTVGQALDDANAVFDGDATALAAVMYPPPVFDPELRQEQESRLRATRYAQPAIGALSVGQFRYLAELGLDCAGYLGHSFGELTALWAAGALTDADFFRLARARGAAMAPPDAQASPLDAASSDPGTMAAVQAGREEIEQILADFPDVVVCNHNAPDQVVVGGGTQAVGEVLAELARRGLNGRLLPVSAAFHTRYVGHAVDRFAADLASVEIGAPTAPVYANTAGASYGTEPAANRAVLGGQLLAPVDFVAGVRAMRADGCNVFVEFGPKQVLAQLTRRILGDEPIAVVSTDGGPLRDGDVMLKQAAVQLAVLGVAITDINRYDPASHAEGGQAARRAAMTITLTGAEYIPDSRRALYNAGLTDGFRVSALAAPTAAAPVADAAAVTAVTPATLTTAALAPAALTPTAGGAPTANGGSVLGGLATTSANGDLSAASHAPAVDGPPAPNGLAVAGAAAAPSPVVAAGTDLDPALVTEAVNRHLDLHTRYLDGQLQITGELVALLRSGASTDQPAWIPAAIEQVAEQSLAAGRTHTRANEVLAALAGLRLPAREDAFLPAPAPAPALPVAPVHAAPAGLTPAPPAGSAAPVVPWIPSQDSGDGVASGNGSTPGNGSANGNGYRPGTPALGAGEPVGTETPASPAASAPVAAGPTADEVRTALLGVVADRTGYPAEMIDTGMDLEADLGVDSIKRVQILGALQEHFPTLPAVGPERLAEMRTLDHITDHVLTSLTNTASSTPTASTTGPATATANGTATTAVSPDAVRTALLSVVADRTGYPAEMIDTGMDLEADLGVDSIKRVQILGALQEHFPTLPAVGPERLAEMRTLDHITDHVLTSLAGPAEPAAGTLDPVAPAAAESLDGGAPLPRRRVELVPTAPVDVLDAAPFGSDPVAVVVDASATGTDAATLAALDEELMGRGFAVRTVRLPAAAAGGTEPGAGTETADEPADPLDEWDAAAVESALTDAFGAGETADLCLLLVGTPAGPDDGSGWTDGIRRLADAVLVAKHAAGPLRRAAARGDRAAFLTITRLDGGLGLRGPEPAVQRLVGGVSGVVKTLAREETSLFCRALDVDPAVAPADLARIALTELWDAAVDLLEVGVDPDGTRWTVRPGPFGASPATATADRDPETGPIDDGEVTKLSPQDTVIVTGGGRGVTADCVRALAARVPAHFVLLGRTEADADPAWAQGVADAALLGAAAADLAARAGTDGPRPTPRQAEAARRDVLARREIRDTLAALAATGATAVYLSVDIADRAAVRAALAPYRDVASALVHGAGALADSTLEAKTPDAVRRVLTPKLTGLRNVLDALGALDASEESRSGAASPLGHLVLFTSVAGLMGNPGQADYAAANEALGRLAAGWKHAAPGRHITAIDWGAWDGGMVDADLRELFRSRGVALIDRAQGAEVFADQFEPPGTADVRLLVGSAEALTGAGGVRPAPALVARRDLGEIAEHPVILHHQVGGFPVLPATFAIGWLAGVVERAHPGLAVVEVRDFDVHKGVVFDGTGELTLRVHAAAAEPDPSAGGAAGTGDRLVVKASVRSPGALPIGVSRYAATLVLAARPPAPTQVEDWSRLEALWSGPGAQDGLEIYTGGTLFHGPLLRGITRVLERADRSLVIECRLPAAPVAHGAFAATLHDPALADLLLHGPSVLGRWVTGQACLPLAVGRIDYRAPLPADEPFAVVVDETQVRDTGLLNRVTAVGRDGRILVRLHDVAMVATPDMAAKFAEGAARWAQEVTS
ncbi:beta keto-acyl synthase [Frankia sp. R43]|uniref:type I polyketide synthase n=1 Tax=Frankia sp. R43 TaxID=269536 RepID=UPI0006DB78F1|nr:type I polyketide synthase [Frankia sp. R43]KPM53925.1 beta keto-acyl synthase [Frankia sp. R43]